MNKYKVLKTFRYADGDGKEALAERGETVSDLNGKHVQGLIDEDYITGQKSKKAKVKKDKGAAPENKQIDPAKENKQSGNITAVRDEYKKLTGKKPFNGWAIDVLQAKIAEHQAHTGT